MELIGFEMLATYIRNGVARKKTMWMVHENLLRTQVQSTRNFGITDRLWSYGKEKMESEKGIDISTINIYIP